MDLSCCEIINEPGFVNLCVYKNTLREINNIKIANSWVGDGGDGLLNDNGNKNEKK